MDERRSLESRSMTTSAATSREGGLHLSLKQLRANIVFSSSLERQPACRICGGRVGQVPLQSYERSFVFQLIWSEGRAEPSLPFPFSSPLPLSILSVHAALLRPSTPRCIGCLRLAFRLSTAHALAPTAAFLDLPPAPHPASPPSTIFLEHPRSNGYRWKV